MIENARTALLLVSLFVIAPAFGRAENLAITFDDLPLNGMLAPGMTRVGMVKDVLVVLRKRRVPQVYGFVNASRFEGDSDGAAALKLWIARGQRVGNHTYSHPDLHKNTPESFLQDVSHNEPVLELLDPTNAWRWFRYPYLREGDTVEKRRIVRGQLYKRGYQIAHVTLDYEDYLWNSAYARCKAKDDAKSIAWLRASYLGTAAEYMDQGRRMAQIVFGRDISHVLLLHLGAFSSAILPDLLDMLKRKGFRLVTLQEAQNDPAYQTDPDAASHWGGTLLEQLMEARKLKQPPVEQKPYKELESICQ